MENAAEALKIFFAVTVFSLAITVFFRMTSLEKDTADSVFTGIDDTTYMDYNSYSASGKYRQVTINEILPTLYRYAQEGYGVTIIDKKDIVARFDLDTESQVSSCIWSDTRYAMASDSEKEKSDKIKEEIRKYLNETIINRVRGNSITDIDVLMKKIYGTTSSEKVFTSWLTGNTYLNNNIAKRVNSDVYGKSVTFEPIGQHNPVLSASGGLLGEYGTEDKLFTEYIVEIDRNEYIKDSNGEATDLLKFGSIRYTKKREVIYTINMGTV